MEPLFLFLVGWISMAVIGFALTVARVSWISVLAALAPHRPSPTTMERRTVEKLLFISSLQETSQPTTPTITQVTAQPLAMAGGPVVLSGFLSGTLVSLSCPTCGLQAPEKLMREHFMGSPIHEYRTSKPLPVTIVSTGFHTVARPVEEESDRTSLGDLLQTLNVMERLLKRDFYRHELRVGSGISARVANIG